MKFKVLLLILIFSLTIRAGLLNFLIGNWPNVKYYAEHLAIIAMFLTLSAACIIQFKLTHEKINFILGDKINTSKVFLSLSVSALLLMLTFGESAIFTLSIAQYNPEKAYELGKFHSQAYNSYPALSPMILSFVFSSVMLPAVFEEIFFRGLVFRSLYYNHSFFKSSVATAAFFTCIHFSQPIYVSTFIFSLVLSYLYAITRSLPTCMIVHATFNLFAFLNQHYFDFHRIRNISQLSHLNDWIPEFIMLGFSILGFSMIIIWSKDLLKKAKIPDLPCLNPNLGSKNLPLPAITISSTDAPLESSSNLAKLD